MNIYTSCTYITIYSGNRLPPFYIGSGFISKILNINKPYRGSVKSKKYKEIWISELKKNPHLFTTNIIKKFKSREEASTHEEYLHKSLNVIKNPLYINMASAKGTFVCIGKQSAEVCAKKSKALLGNKNRCGVSHTEDHKHKVSQFMKAIPRDDSWKNKISETMKTSPIIVECPHCGKYGQKQNMVRWHFDNCKDNKKGT
jgi:hypothetical protein